MSVALVTGGAGFVGCGVVLALARRGWSVRVLDPGPPHPRWPAGVVHVRGSLLMPADLAEAARGAEVVFHVAGLWDGKPGGDARMRAVNVDGTHAVLGLGRPVVYTSSSITCGFGSLAHPGAEDDPSEDPAHPIRGVGRVYRQTKLEAEALVGLAGGFVVNPDYVVGLGDIHGVVTRPLLRVARSPVIPAPKGGKCFVDVDDVGEGHVLALERGRPGRRYLLGAENRTYADIFQTLARLLGRRPLLVPLPDALPRALAGIRALGGIAGPLEQMTLARFRDSRRARAELGWTPGPVDDALRRMIEEDRRGRRG